MRIMIKILIFLGLLVLGLLLWVVLGRHGTTMTVTRTIDAPIETVFQSVSDIESFPDIQPEVLSIEFLTESRSGQGTRFRETRRHGKQEMVTELEVTEFVENERIRMVTDSHGTVWDTIFVVRPEGSGAELSITMDARPHKLLPKIMNPLLKGTFRKGIESYADLLRDHCEGAREVG